MRIYIGTYTLPLDDGMKAEAEGIYLADLDTGTGDLGTPVLVARCTNPSYLAADPSGRLLYAVQEVFADSAPAVHAFTIGEDGALEPHSTQPVPGELPCHLAVDPAGQRLATAQYWTGDAAIFGLGPDGGIGTLVARLARSGSGPNAERQEGPHAHYAAFTDGGRWLHVTDLGTDQVRSYVMPPDTGNDGAGPVLCALAAGSGPRHLAVTADETTAFVGGELDETVTLLRRSGPGWTAEQAVPVFDIDPGTEGSVAALRLSPDERHIYVSGRRQSEIACLEWNAGVGSLALVSRTSAGGETPRDFMITSDGRWIVSAGQTGNRLTCFRRDVETGALEEVSSRTDIANPVALLEVPAGP